MKKLLSILLVLSMIVCFAACGKKDDEEPIGSGDVDGPVAGGWTVNADNPEGELPEEAKAAFDAAMEGFTGVGYKPVAFLGSQVVAGLNYAFLCVSTTVVPDAVPGLAVVTIYKDLEGNATVLNVADVDLANYANVEGDLQFPEDGIVGGFSIENACGVGLAEDYQASFKAALEGLSGVGYEPLAKIGSQVVAGENFAVLAKATRVTATPQSALAVLTIYKGVDGSNQLLTIAPFSIGE